MFKAGRERIDSENLLGSTIIEILVARGNNKRNYSLQ